MKKAIEWMARNHVASNLLMAIFVIGGIIMTGAVKQEVFPEINLDRINITVAYPGASPEETEEGIVLKVEESISGIDGIKEINSKAAEGTATITAVLDLGEDSDQILNDIKSEVDRITTLPEDAEKPVISKMVLRREAISLVVYGEVSERSLREWADKVRDDLLAMPTISQAELNGVRDFEISIEVSEENLRRYGLTLDGIAQLVAQSSLDLPGGSIKADGGEILIRTKERKYIGREYGQIPILAQTDGATVRLGDIAVIKDEFAETDTYATFDGMPAAMVVVYRVGDQKPLAISDTVLQYIKDKKGSLPDSIHLAAWNDNSELYQSRLNLLLKNAGIGLTLVFVVLGLFLQIRLAIWVMLGIPISFLGALLLMPGLDVSINMISLFAFIMALGIVVDDAIVVGENIFEHRLRGKSHIQAAIDGAKEVFIPVTFSILTSIAAFLPLLFVVGTLGKFIKVIPLVVISILAISWVESFFVLPSHLSLTRGKAKDDNDQPTKPIKRKKFSLLLDKFVHGPYRKALSLCLTFRYINVALAVATLFFTIGLVKGGIVKFTFMPVVDGDKVQVSLQMPLGTLAKNTGEITKHLVETGMETVHHFDKDREEGDTILRHIYAVTGGTMAGDGPRGKDASSGSHLGDISMLLAPSDTRNLAAMDIANQWRKLVGEPPGVDHLTYNSNLIHMGANIDVQFAHHDYETLVAATRTLKEALKRYPGVYDVVDSYPLGKKELKIRLKPEARSLGITEAVLARRLRSAFYGAEALRLQRGRNEVKVMVRYPADQRISINDLDNMRIRTPAGVEIPLHQAAYIEQGRGFSVINRSDRKRVINITASVNDKTANAEEIITDLKNTTLRDLLAEHQDLTYNLEGEEKEKRESLQSMKEGFFIALLAIYSLLAIPLRSYSQPLLIMMAIPFGIVGAIFGHLIMGFNLSMLSIFGIVALSGVVVNDSLLLIDYINHSRRKGASLYDAVQKAGLRRFRPILLTSLTTFFGLMPMILEKSVQAKFLIPMAISLGFGIIYATMITLLLIPSIYMIAEDVRRLLGLRPTYHRLKGPTR